MDVQWTKYLVVIFHFSWKMWSDVWGSISDQGVVTHITGGNFAQSSIAYIVKWLCDFLREQASEVIQSYSSSLSAYGLFFLGAHFVWLVSCSYSVALGIGKNLLNLLFGLIKKWKFSPSIQPRAFSIVQGHAVGVAH
jgi:photosystem I P700 chlorophyll a apoprotein A1